MNLNPGVLRAGVVVVRGAGDGVVLYTTFHNELQITDDMDKLPREFVLSL